MREQDVDCNIGAAFAKIVVLTPDQNARDRLKHRFRAFAAGGAVPEARLRATQIVFGPPSPFPVAFRVTGPETGRVRDIAEQVRAVMLRNRSLRQVNTDWGERARALHFVFDQDRLRAFGLSSQDARERREAALKIYRNTILIRCRPWAFRLEFQWPRIAAAANRTHAMRTRIPKYIGVPLLLALAAAAGMAVSAILTMAGLTA